MGKHQHHNIDVLVTSRHPVAERGPGFLQLPGITGFPDTFASENDEKRVFLTFYGGINFDVDVRSQNNDVPRGRGRCRHRYRKLIHGLFDPDTDSDPDADKAETAFFTTTSIYLLCPKIATGRVPILFRVRVPARSPGASRECGNPQAGMPGRYPQRPWRSPDS